MSSIRAHLVADSCSSRSQRRTRRVTPCNGARCTRLTAQAQAPDSSSPSSPSNPAPKPLSPQGWVTGASGVDVNGYSPTSLQGWQTIKQTLKDSGVKMLSAQEVIFAQERGIPIIDVRPEDQYDAGHIPGAVNVPFFQPITGWEPAKIARRVGFALFGVLNGTEANPNFARDALAKVDPQKGAVLYCSIGGTVDPAEGSKKGLQSRSLIAAWQLVTNGASNISVMKGGYSEWVSAGREISVMVADE